MKSLLLILPSSRCCCFSYSCVAVTMLLLLLTTSSMAFSPISLSIPNTRLTTATTRKATVSSSSSSSSSAATTTTTTTTTDASTTTTSTTAPLLIRAARGETVERTPVWMMRQAGRHMQAYRDLCKTYPTFRQRSEIAQVAVEISLQPHRAYQTDGCILFSDILTPLPGMGCDFVIDEVKGPVMANRITSYDDLKLIHTIDPSKSTPFVAEALEELRRQVLPGAAVLGFVGSPYTLATYLIEGKTSRDYLATKRMMWQEPKLMHQLLQVLADNIANYALFQIEHGAQLIQLFDSWAGHLSPKDYDAFCAPYQTMVMDKIRQVHPEVPTVLYIKHSGALVERMAATGVDVVSLDWTVDMAEGRDRVQQGRQEWYRRRISNSNKDDDDLSVPPEHIWKQDRGAVQGNLDPAILLGPADVIRERTIEILQQAGPTGHVMNLGHGIEAETTEEHAHLFIETVRNYRHET